MPVRIILVTHALTDWNVRGKIQGHNDVPLNSTGRYMAALLSQRLGSEPVDSIYASDLRRAYETAEPTAALKSLVIHRDYRLREVRSARQEKNSEFPLLDFPVSLETEADVLERMKEVLTEIVETNLTNNCILVVSHAGAVDLFINNVLRETGDLRTFQNIRTALNHLSFSKGGWRCLGLDGDLHLRGQDLV